MNRKEKIAKRLEHIPKIHQAVYLSAAQGKSRKNAVKAFCMECVQYQKEEVKLCSDLGCPLYMYRPYGKSIGKNSKSADHIC